MAEHQCNVPPAPPLPKILAPSRDVLHDLLEDEEDPFRDKRFQKDLQFRMVGAIERENTELMEELIKAGVDTNATIVLVKTPLIHALEGPTLNIGILKLLLGENTKTDPNQSENTPTGLKPLHVIAKKGLIVLARLLLESPRGAICEIDGKDKGGATPLHFAIYHNHEEMVMFLIDKGADIFAVDNVGRSTLHRACETQNFKIAELLLEKGVSIDTMDKFWWTPIFHSVFLKHVDMVKFLIDRGANVDSRDIYGESLIRVACYLQWVSERGKHYPVDIVSRTSFDFVERCIKIPTVALKELLYDLDDRLHDITESKKHFEMLKLLINSGTDPNSYPSDGWAQMGEFDAINKARAYLMLAGSFLDPADPWVTTKTPWQDWFVGQLDEQYSLKRQCRRCVRRALKQTRDIDIAIDGLPLPDKMRLYLKLKDFDQLVEGLEWTDRVPSMSSGF